MKDKAALVRKAAAACVTNFLTCNIYGARMQLSVMEEELAKEEGELREMRNKLMSFDEEKIEEIEKQWKEKEEDIRNVIEKMLEGVLLCFL